jgi:hypothetical protein
VHWKAVRAISESFLWTVLIVAFASISAPIIFRDALNNATQFAGPFHSSNSFIYFDTGTVNASERLIGLFDSVPSTQTIVIFVRGDDRRSPFIGMVAAYLAWPHPVQIVDLKNADPRRKPAAIDYQSAGAFVLCRVNAPPSWAHGERFGDTLEVFTATQLARR